MFISNEDMIELQKYKESSAIDIKHLPSDLAIRIVEQICTELENHDGNQMKVFDIWIRKAGINRSYGFFDAAERMKRGF